MGKIFGAVVINEDRCKGCALCVDACPKDVLALAERKVNVHGYSYVEAIKAMTASDVLHVELYALMAALPFIVKKWTKRKIYLWRRKK